MKLAIVGSRKFFDYETLSKFILDNIDINKVELIISGGAMGTDSLAKDFANNWGISFLEIRPDYAKFRNNPKYAPLVRNEKIAKECDVMIAFVGEDSRGTKNAIGHANNLHKEVIKYEI